LTDSLELSLIFVFNWLFSPERSFIDYSSRWTFSSKSYLCSWSCFL